MAVKQRREFLKVQWGEETTPGTIVAATAIAAALTDIRYRPDTIINTPAKLNGSLAVANDVAVLGKAGMLQIGGYLTFEEVNYLLEMGYKDITPSADGGTPIAYTRVAEPTLTAADDPKTRTVEVGTNQEAFVLPYSFLETWGFTAKVKDFSNFNATIRAQDFIEQAFTGALTPHQAERVLGQQWKAYVANAAFGAMGGGDITDCLTDLAFDSGPLYMWANCMNGLLTPESHVQQGQQPSITLTLQLSPTSLDFLRKYQAGDKCFVRLRNYGSVIHGDAVVTAPIAAPTTAVGAAGVLDGDYLYKYTYVNAYGETTGGLASTLVSPSDQKVNVSVIAASADPSVTARRLYRTVDAGVVYKFLVQINDNTTTTYVDNIPDSDLGATLPIVNTAATTTTDFVRKMLQIDMCGAITAYPDVGQAVSEGSLSVPITFTGTQDDGGSWGKLIQITTRTKLATLA
jgi:hypothetical protein